MTSQRIKRMLLAASFVGLLLLGGAYAGHRKYVSLRQERLLAQARQYLAQSDNPRARLCLQRALRYNPRDLAACRLMAQLAESAHLADALSWRSRVVELNPRSLEDRLDLAQTFVMLRDFASATNVLDGVLPPDRKTAAYHNVAGGVAAAANHSALAEAHFLEAARLDPANKSIQLSLAVVRLHGTNETALARGRTTLKLLASDGANSAVRCQALRELVIDAVHREKLDDALALSEELLRETNSVFKDRFLRLEVLRQTRDAGFKPALAAYQREAAQQQGELYELATWEMEKISPAETLAWLRSVPVAMQTNQPAALLIAECETMAGDWPSLQSFLEPQNWADLEFLRHAFLARTQLGRQLTDSSTAQWEQALRLANGQKANLGMLLRLAAQWNMAKEAEAILWTMVEKYPDEKWAFAALARTLFVDGRTRSLMQLYAQETKQSPLDLAAKNNLAVTALLLDAQELKPQELAREVYQKEPTNPAYASTYALALYMRKNNAAALKVLEQLNPLALEQPAVSGCYGLVLQATGNMTKARKYLNLSSSASLLPEQRRLVEKAKAGI